MVDQRRASRFDVVSLGETMLRLSVPTEMSGLKSLTSAQAVFCTFGQRGAALALSQHGDRVLTTRAELDDVLAQPGRDVAR